MSINVKWKEKGGNANCEQRRTAERRHELEMKQLELESVNNGHCGVNNASSVAVAKLPKLPNFTDGKDDLDSYLQRF